MNDADVKTFVKDMEATLTQNDKWRHTFMLGENFVSEYDPRKSTEPGEAEGPISKSGLLPSQSFTPEMLASVGFTDREQWQDRIESVLDTWEQKWDMHKPANLSVVRIGTLASIVLGFVSFALISTNVPTADKEAQELNELYEEQIGQYREYHWEHSDKRRHN